MKLKEIKHKKIAFACLDWGMGHLTRSIGILRTLLEQENKIVFFGDVQQFSYLKFYIKDFDFVELKGYQLTFSGSNNFSKELWNNRNNWFQTMKMEHEHLANYCLNQSIDVVISDHRYGFYHPEISSVFITHQLSLPLNFWQRPIQKLHERWMQKFDVIWVPDFENHMLSGKLSKTSNASFKIEFIGPQSRFISHSSTGKTVSTLVILSGPEKYAIALHDSIFRLAKYENENLYVIHHKQVHLEHKNPKWIYIDTSNPLEQDKLIEEAQNLISHSGYSLIMDLHQLEKKGALIPTKGQKEQEYLYQLHVGKMIGRMD